MRKPSHASGLVQARAAEACQALRRSSSSPTPADDQGHARAAPARVVACDRSRCDTACAMQHLDQGQGAHVGGGGEREADEPELRGERAEEAGPERGAPDCRRLPSRAGAVEDEEPGDEEGGLQRRGPRPASSSPGSGRTRNPSRQDRAPEADRREAEEGAGDEPEEHRAEPGPGQLRRGSPEDIRTTPAVATRMASDDSPASAGRRGARGRTARPAPARS